MAEPNRKVQTIFPPSTEELIYSQVQENKIEIRETRKELSARMDKLDEKIDTTRREFTARMDKQDARMDKLEEKIDKLDAKFTARMDKFDEKLDSTRKELTDKIDALHKDIHSRATSGTIANISTVGIALGVIYSLFNK